MNMLVPYVYYPGTCEEAFRFYAETVGGNIAALMKFRDAPPGSMSPSPAFSDKAMYACYQGPGIMLMATDAEGSQYHRPVGFDIMLSLDTPEEAERVFRAFSEGGDVTMPMAETFWAKRFGKVTDRFGIPWMINCPKPMPAAQ